MQRDKEELARLIRQSSKQAITLAMEGRWKEAVETNRSILENFPEDVDTLNRLGRAYMELGAYSEAKSAYSQAQKLDMYNPIAEKNLKRLENLVDDLAQEDAGKLVEPRYFIEETGKAGVVRLINLASREILAKLVAGDRVNLETGESFLTVTNEKGEEVGRVDPLHSKRLLRLIAGGNRYLATVTSSSDDGVAIIIREIYQHPSQAGQLSFPSKGLEAGRPFVSDKLLRRQMEYEDNGMDDNGSGLGLDDEGEGNSDDASEESDEEEE